MAIFGEETIEVDIFNGISPSPTHRKKHLCLDVTNLIKTGPKEYTVREDFVLIQNKGLVFSNTNIATNPVPEYSSVSQTKVFTATGIQGTDSPSLITAFTVAGVTNTVTWLNYNSATAVNYTQTIANNRQVRAFCQYKDRYYASNGIDWIFRVSNFAIAIPPLIVGDLANVGVGILKAFKNRIFGFTKNRIYWTDLPAIGGYPETWNLTTNFSDMPAIDRDITIYNVQIYRDKMYIFTDKGIYYFLVNGDPLNWSIQLISSNFAVFSTDSVCLSNNVLFFTDQKAAYSFDGVKFSRISDNVKEIFYNSGWAYTIIGLFPFENGIILSRNDFSNNANTYAAGGSRTYYYDLDIWVNISLDNSANAYGQYSSFIRADRNFIPYVGFKPTSFLAYMDGNVGGSTTIVALKPGKWQGDCFVVDHIAGFRDVKKFSLIGPAFLLDNRRYKKLKYFNIYGKFNPTADNWIQISSYERIAPVVAKGVLLVDYSQYNAVIRAPIDGQLGPLTGRSRFVKDLITVNIFGQSTYSKEVVNTVGNQPPIIITGVEAILNLDNAQLTKLVT